MTTELSTLQKAFIKNQNALDVVINAPKEEEEETKDHQMSISSQEF